MSLPRAVNQVRPRASTGAGPSGPAASAVASGLELTASPRVDRSARSPAPCRMSVTTSVAPGAVAVPRAHGAFTSQAEQPSQRTQSSVDAEPVGGLSRSVRPAPWPARSRYRSRSPRCGTPGLGIAHHDGPATTEADLERGDSALGQRLADRPAPFATSETLGTRCLAANGSCHLAPSIPADPSPIWVLLHRSWAPWRTARGPLPSGVVTGSSYPARVVELRALRVAAVQCRAADVDGCRTSARQPSRW